MSRLQDKLDECFNTENPQRDILLELLDKDREFCKKLCEAYGVSDCFMNYDELELVGELPINEGRADIIIRDQNFCFQLELKRIDKRAFDNDDTIRLENYLQSTETNKKIGLLLRNPNNINITEKDLFAGAQAWTDVGKLINNHFLIGSEHSNDNELIYWANFLLNKIEATRIMGTPLKTNDLIALNLKESSLIKLKHHLKTIFAKKNYYQNEFTSSIVYRNYNSWNRVGLQLVCNSIGLFWGFRTEIDSGYPNLYAMLEVNPQLADLRKQLIEAKKDIESKFNKNYHINYTEEGWQIFSIYEPLKKEFVEKEFDEQVTFLENWFDQCKEDFKKIINKLGN